MNPDHDGGNLQGGPADLRARAFFDALARKDRSLGLDVPASIAIGLLFAERVLRPERLAQAGQSNIDDATRTLDALVAAGSVERLLDGSRIYRLSPAAATRLGHRLSYRTYTRLEEQMDRVDALLDVLPDVSRSDLVAHLGLSDPYASRVLGAMVGRGRIESTTSVVRRGPGMRYRRLGRPSVRVGSTQGSSERSLPSAFDHARQRATDAAAVEADLAPLQHPHKSSR